MDAEGFDKQGYDDFIKTCNAAMSANSALYARSLSTLSGIFIGLNVTFEGLGASLMLPKDLVTSLVPPWLPALSLIFFTLTIIGTITSFMYSEWLLKRAKRIAKVYYRVEDVEAKEKKLEEDEKFTKAMPWLNALNGVLFILGVGTTTLRLIL